MVNIVGDRLTLFSGLIFKKWKISTCHQGQSLGLHWSEIKSSQMRTGLLDHNFLTAVTISEIVHIMYFHK